MTFESLVWGALAADREIREAREEGTDVEAHGGALFAGKVRAGGVELDPARIGGRIARVVDEEGNGGPLLLSGGRCGRVSC